MDAGTALVTSAALVGQTYDLPGPGGFRLIVSSVDSFVAGEGPLGPFDTLVGLETQISYEPTWFDIYA